RTNAEGNERQVQRNGAVGDRNAVPCAYEVPEVVLELLHVGAATRDPRGDEGIEHRAELVPGHVRRGDLNRLRGSIDDNAGQMASGLAHRLQHIVTGHVVAKLVGRGQGTDAGEMPFHRRVDNGRAVNQSFSNVVERDAADQTPVVLNDQAPAQAV